MNVFVHYLELNLKTKLKTEIHFFILPSLFVVVAGFGFSPAGVAV
jgi:hypothetical protein